MADTDNCLLFEACATLGSVSNNDATLPELANNHPPMRLTMMNNTQSNIVKWDNVRQATTKDETLQNILSLLHTGFPLKKY